MSDYGTNVGEKFARTALMGFFAKAVSPEVTNSDYEGEIKGGGADRLNVLTFGDLSLQAYSGTALSPEVPSESEGTLLVNQKYAYYFKIDSISKFSSYVNNPESQLMKNAGDVLAKQIDQFVLGLYGDVAAGNRIGTDYTTGTVTITATTGATVGSGTTFTSGMVGRGFKATGHSVWYRVKTFTNTTSIAIENDVDDVASAYSGGAISGAAYTVEANTKLQVAKATIYGYICNLSEKLDAHEIPAEGRWLAVPSKIASIIRQAPEFIPAVESAYNDVVKNGVIGKISNFVVHQTERVTGNNTDGYRVLAGHKSFITMAVAFTESEVEPFIGGFGKCYKGLTVYGAKVVDVRRKCGVEGFWYV